MKPSEYKQLESDKEFKKHYLKKTLWWKNFLFFAPTCLLFIGLAGIMNMAYTDMIWTWYAVPYIVVFALGTIWLKALKKYVQNKQLENKERYLVCAAKSLGDQLGRYYFIFSKNNKRHNEPLIHSLAEELSLDSFTVEELKNAQKKITEINCSEQETQVYLVAIKVDTVLKANRENIGKGITPLIYISAQNTFVVRNKDLI